MSRSAPVTYDLEAGNVRHLLELMEADEALNTEATYSANAVLYPDHRMPFTAKHMAYLKAHPRLDPQQYLANLRLMTRIR